MDARREGEGHAEGKRDRERRDIQYDYIMHSEFIISTPEVIVIIIIICNSFLWRAYIFTHSTHKACPVMVLVYLY